MDRWGSRQSGVLLIVLALHLALLAALLMTSPNVNSPASAAQPVELMVLPPVKFPKVRAESAPPRRVTGNTAVAMALPALDAPAIATAAQPAAADGRGLGVDWAAEKRRALQAFEIRSHQPSGNESVSGEPADDSWSRQAQHHAGDEFRVANGDWIVWIDANCYQVASSNASAVQLPASPKLVCLKATPPGKTP